jgi:hypothetical protein
MCMRNLNCQAGSFFGLRSYLRSCFLMGAHIWPCFLANIIFISIPIVAEAEFIDPSTIQVKTETYVPDFTDFKRGTYVYEVSWKGIPVAEASVEVDSLITKEGKESYKVEAKAATNKVIDVFYKLRHSSDSSFDAESLRPMKFTSIQTENSRKRSSEISFGKNGEISSFTEKNGRIEDERRFTSDNLTLDPISAAFLARSIPIEIGKKVDFDVYNAKNRYLISFLVVEIENIRVEGSSKKSGKEMRLAYKVVPSIQKLTDSEGEKRFSKATIWISADEHRDVLKIESEVLVGSIGAYLKKFSPSNDTEVIDQGLSLARSSNKESDVVRSKEERSRASMK